MIESRINTEAAGFGIEGYKTDPGADTFEPIVVHALSDAIISESTSVP